jgi:caa(3)-type oxidase subunit IV
MTDAHSTHGRDIHHVHYRAIFIALCVCTGLSVAFDLVPLTKAVIAVLVLAVAVAKAQFVMRYFMHLKFEGKWKYVLLLPTAILACGIPLALAPDISLHYYAPVTPQSRTVHAVARGEHGSAAHETEAEPETSEAPAEQ